MGNDVVFEAIKEQLISEFKAAPEFIAPERRLEVIIPEKSFRKHNQRPAMPSLLVYAAFRQSQI